MDDPEIWLRAWVTVFAFLLMAVSLISYRRMRSNRLLLVSVVFCIFFVKGVILTLGIFMESADDIATAYWFNSGFDLAVLLFLFFAVWRSPRGKARE